MTAGVCVPARAPAGQSRPRALHLPFDGRRSFETLLDGSSVAASWALRWLASSRRGADALMLGTLFVAWLRRCARRRLDARAI